jgi:hypothetical protein
VYVYCVLYDRVCTSVSVSTCLLSCSTDVR